MIFHGFQKMTLLDYPGRVACTVFTGGCNLRCPFCHNALLVTDLSHSDNISEAEILSFLDKRKGLLDGVAITGGEPLLNDDIFSFIEKVREKGFSVKLDTNGCFPHRLKYLINNKLVDYVAMDIKNSKELYGETVGIENFDISDVEKSVDILIANNVDYEFRTTVVNEFHSLESISDISKWIKGAKGYYLQNFIDSGNLISNSVSGVPLVIMQKMLEISRENVPQTFLRGV